MFLKLEEVPEERQTVVRCGGVNKGPVFPVATPALEEIVKWRDSPEVQTAGDVWVTVKVKVEGIAPHSWVIQDWVDEQPSFKGM